MAPNKNHAFKLQVPFSLALAAVLLLASAPPVKAQPHIPAVCHGTRYTTNSMQSSGDTMQFYGNSNYGIDGECGQCHFSIVASDSMRRTRPGKPDTTLSVELFAYCYDCHNDWWAFQWDSTATSSGLVVKKEFATLDTTFASADTTYNENRAPTTARINLRGTPVGRSTNVDCRIRTTRTSDPCGIVFTQVVSTTSAPDYLFTGSITIGDNVFPSTTYPAPYDNGYITGRSDVRRQRVRPN